MVQTIAQPIPKTIHYCWFGGARLPSIAKRCIRSWKKHCPDYEIIEWNENTFEVAKAPIYVQQAYDARKWAFVSDYVRLFVLYNQGGVYMDTDLEVIRPIDAFLKHRAFSSFENEHSIPTAIMGSEARNGWIGMLLNDYENRQFVRPDGSYDCTTNVITITTLTVKHYGIVLDNTYQELRDGVVIYPNSYFCPKVFSIGQVMLTDDTHTVHHYEASWFDKDEARKYRLHRRLYPTIGVAFEAYNRGDWKTAYQKGLRGLLENPRCIGNRGMWAVILKSLWRARLPRHNRNGDVSNGT